MDYVINNICYKKNCPQGTILDTSNPSSRNCKCIKDSKIDPITGLITCIEAYPEEHYSNKAQCPFIYEGNCVLQCPENTCLNPILDELVNCINETENILGVELPKVTIPVMPGRNLAVIMELAAMNNRQKNMGYNAAETLVGAHDAAIDGLL